jgi:uncharacterized protein YeaO (DUF488 family)
MIDTDRIYNLTGEEQEYHILVDGIWPRGIRKEDPRINEWIKEIAPSRELRKWFSHDPEKWDAFRKAYISELQERRPTLEKIKKKAENRQVVLVYSARNEQYNHALVLKEVIEQL